MISVSLGVFVGRLMCVVWGNKCRTPIYNKYEERVAAVPSSQHPVSLPLYNLPQAATTPANVHVVSSCDQPRRYPKQTDHDTDDAPTPSQVSQKFH